MRFFFFCSFLRSVWVMGSLGCSCCSSFTCFKIVMSPPTESSWQNPVVFFFFSSLSRSGRLHCFNTELCIRCVSGPLYCWTTSGFLRCPFQSFGLDYYSVRGCCYQSLLRLVTFRRLLVLPFSLLKPSLLFSLFFFLRL